MQYRAILESEWRDLQGSFSAGADIVKRSTKIANWLGMRFDGQEIGGVTGLKFEPIDRDNCICTVTSPFGIGRIQRNWTILNGVLHGALVVSRKSSDEQGRECWEPVWRLYVPDRGPVFVEEPNDGFELRENSGRALENDVFALGMSIFWTIVSGPAVK